ncbi:hypothetical protein [Salinibacterium sp. ZJ450]|uniref:hypothetical protein n=1 Tax=Salinibacterium sp. ZJ450 TaxID=2708338 RepID=UPI0014246A9E|nr:hypothetical protein [Salinibacterium sp. ZJ450]
MVLRVTATPIDLWGATTPPTEEPALAEWLPGAAAYRRVLNPARSDQGAFRWQACAGDDFRVDAQTQWPDIRAHRPDVEGRYGTPEMGGLDADVAAALARVLRDFTTTPDEVYFMAWEGYAGLKDVYRSSALISGPNDRNLYVVRGTLDDVLASVEEPPFKRLPLWWVPADRAWCVGNDIYALSAFVGGSEECATAIAGEGALESYVAIAGQSVVPEEF